MGYEIEGIIGKFHREPILTHYLLASTDCPGASEPVSSSLNKEAIHT